MKIYIARDSTIKLQVSKVVKLLNSKCRFIEFEELKLSYQAPDKLISHPTTHSKYIRHIKPELKCNEFIVLVTEVQYDNNFFYEEHEGLYILSFFAWEYLTTLPGGGIPADPDTGKHHAADPNVWRVQSGSTEKELTHRSASVGSRSTVTQSHAE